MQSMLTRIQVTVVAALLAAAVIGGAGPLAAQGGARGALLEDWAHQRRHILAVVDSATPDMLEFRPTPGVRTFAEQIFHLSHVAALIVGRAVTDTPWPPGLVGDSAGYLHDRAKLRAQADTLLGFVATALARVSEDDLRGEQTLAGMTLSRWRWNITALQHSAWTLGQLVPYLRLNGRTPPQFTPL